MDEDIVVPLAFFATIVIISLGIPIVLAWRRRFERTPLPAPLSPELSARLDRLEAMVETVSIEVERMAEGQRFTTKLLSEGAAKPIVPQPQANVPVGHAAGDHPIR